MVVKITTALKNALEADKLDSNLFCDAFKEWKSGDEYGSFHFGKDGAYVTPLVNGDRGILRHVHLVPIVDQKQLVLWKKRWKFRGRKTSDRVLIYAQDYRGNFLLIFILSEPDAHAIAGMKTKNHKEIMEGFAVVAEAFIYNGQVIA